MSAQPRTRQKVTAEHLARTAYLYVRQSTLRQVMQNTESTQRQYALRQRAIAAGLAGRADGRDRRGPGAVRRVARRTAKGSSGSWPRWASGKAGIVLGLEVSRLARNNASCRRRHDAF